MEMDISKLEQLQRAYSSILSSEQDNLIHQLQEYTETLDLIRSHYSSLPVTLPRTVTIPVIFRRTNDEKFISDYLAYVLDPNRNGLGISPIQSLMQLAFPDFGEVDPIDPIEISIIREFDTGDGLIDLLIQVDDIFVLGIENKISSPETDGQTVRYNRRLRELFKDQTRYLIYLTPNGQEPRSKAFLPVSYRQMLSAFRLIRYDWHIDIHKSVIWEDFLSHLEEYIVMDINDFEFSPRSQLYLENHLMITELEKTFQKDWSALLDYLEARLSDYFEPDTWQVDFSNRRRDWYSMRKKNWKQGELDPHYVFMLSPADLAQDYFRYAFSVDGEGFAEFVERFLKKYPKLRQRYDKLGIEILPAREGKWAREHYLAFKKYSLDPPLSKIAEQWIAAYEEFSFLNDVIDELLEDFKSKIPKK